MLPLLQEIKDMEKCIDRITLAISSQDPPLKVAQSRLKKRMRRPQVELCNDGPHHSLIVEVRDILENIRQLENKLQESNSSLADLAAIKQKLDQNIKVKKNSLQLDQQRCMSLRKHFPFAIPTLSVQPFF